VYVCLIVEPICVKIDKGQQDLNSILRNQVKACHACICLVGAGDGRAGPGRAGDGGAGDGALGRRPHVALHVFSHSVCIKYPAIEQESSCIACEQHQVAFILAA
jgi:hypothetical protein